MPLPRLPVALGGALTLLGSITALGQSLPPPPAFQFLRWQEDWSRWKPVSPTDAWSALKHRELGSAAWLSLGGDVRLRTESWRNFNFGAPAGVSHDDAFSLGRWRTHADLHLDQGLRLFAELKGAYASDRDLPGGVRAIDEDKFELQQAFVEFDLPGLAADSGLRVRAGRQLLAFGAQRLVSGLPWANALRTWDGARLDAEVGDWKISAFGAAFVPTTSRGIGTADRDNQLWGLYATRRGADVYLLRNHWPTRTFNGSSGRDARWTLGTRLWGQWTAQRDYHFELSAQTGSVGPHDVGAWSVAGQVGFKPRAGNALRLWAGLDWASGDGRAGGRVGTFNQLYPLGHAYFGIADVIGRQNSVDLSLGLTWKPVPAFSADLAWHHFRVADTADAIYNPAGGVVRTGGSYTDPEIGQELNLVVKWPFNRHLGFEAGWARVFAGPAIRQSGPAADINFTYLSTGATF